MHSPTKLYNCAWLAKSLNFSKICELMDSALVGKGHRSLNKEEYKQSLATKCPGCMLQ